MNKVSTMKGMEGMKIRTFMLAMIFMVALLTGCAPFRPAHQVAQLTPNLDPRAGGTFNLHQATPNVQAADTFVNLPAPPLAKEIDIPCAYTNGYVYLAVSTDLIHWEPFDTNIYDASLPHVESVLTGFINPDIPVRFATYMPTNLPAE